MAVEDRVKHIIGELTVRCTMLQEKVEELLKEIEELKKKDKDD